MIYHLLSAINKYIHNIIITKITSLNCDFYSFTHTYLYNLYPLNISLYQIHSFSNIKYKLIINDKILNYNDFYILDKHINKKII